MERRFATFKYQPIINFFFHIPVALSPYMNTNITKNITITPFFLERSMTLFLAPTAWGKTSMLLDIFSGSGSNDISGILFISPLKAIAIELEKRLKEKFKHIYRIESRRHSKECLRHFKSNQCSFIIATAEVLSFENIDFIGEQEKKILIVFDEFHLIFYWGLSFRPILWEIFLGLACSEKPILGLSASMDARLLDEWKRDFTLGFEHLFLIDLGNRQLKKEPISLFEYQPSFVKSFRQDFIYKLLNNHDKTYLYFCAFRNEVEAWLRFCNFHRIPALGCRGGEVIDFMKQLAANSNIRVIFATQALSHGVNLPELSKIFISYHVENNDLRLQMIGRGGRHGEDFEVFMIKEPSSKITFSLTSLLTSSLTSLLTSSLTSSLRIHTKFRRIIGNFLRYLWIKLWIKIRSIICLTRYKR
ncbi:MAG: DEAD/DEAH box helicase [Oligoflexia bacterium]|nr:DEAD/DEAH box helicase [Oligoflexia bacterium]